MTWRALPPAGHPIALSGQSGELPVFAGYHAAWVNSGTAALALAFLLARHRYPQLRKPEVVLPGYACPDLVAAAVHAGVQPVLADIGADDPSYDLNSLSSVLSPSTVAVVAVNFLGIQERMPELRELLSGWPAAALIEDDAQWFPEPPTANSLKGDVVCLSFGRGKPVSLLGGGALLMRDSFVQPASVASLVSPSQDTGSDLNLKFRLYNALLNPWCYGLLSRNPLLKLGNTEFKPLHHITALDLRRLNLLPSNIQNHLTRSAEAAAHIHLLLPPAMDLPARLPERSARLLRYPVLCEGSRQRDALWAKLRRAGLGASVMYRHPLAAIEGAAPYLVATAGLPGARRFADRLLTLPVHAGVSGRNLERIGKILNSTM